MGAGGGVVAGAELFGLLEVFFLAFFGLGFFLAVVVVDVEVEEVVFTATCLVLPGLALLLLPHPAATRARAMAEIRTRFMRPLFESARVRVTAT